MVHECLVAGKIHAVFLCESSTCGLGLQMLRDKHEDGTPHVLPTQCGLSEWKSWAVYYLSLAPD